MPTQRDYYEILSVEKTSDGEEIKRAYRRLAMKYHPDRNPGDAEAEAKFKEAAEAYEVLSDQSRRQRYDQFGHEGLRSGPAAHDFSRMSHDDIFSMFSDIFEGFGFQGGGARGGRGQGGVPRGFNLETEVSISLEDVLKGCERTIEFTRLDVCEKCTGTGAKPGSKPERCKTCGGHGKVQQSGLGGMFRMVTACPACAGRGQIVREFCDGCRGKGRVSKKRSLSVRIPPGVHAGQEVRIRSEGEPPPPEHSPSGEGIRGDLHVVVRVAEHEMFQRDGNNLILEMPLPFTQAALGAEVEVRTLDASEKLTIARGTQHGDLFRVASAGLPDLRTGRRGDLVLIAKIEVPKKLSKEQEKLLRAYAAEEHRDVLPETQGFWKKMKERLTG